VRGLVRLIWAVVVMPRGTVLRYGARVLSVVLLRAADYEEFREMLS
jgi:general stress protein CsbA